MKPHRIGVAAVVYGIVDALVIVAPAAVLRFDALRSELDLGYGRDLVVASGVLAALHAVFASRRLARTAASAVRRADVWIAALDALVVLALAATGLLTAVLIGFAGMHTRLASRGWPVVALWIGVQIVAIAVSELVGRAVFRWLEPSGDAGADSNDGAVVRRKRPRSHLEGVGT